MHFNSKKAAVDFFKDRIANDDRWVVGALKTLENYQTAEEKALKETIIHNDAGFQPRHAKFCSTVARYKYLYPSTMEKLRAILPHYCGQLVEHCRNKGTVVIDRKARSDKEAENG